MLHSMKKTSLIALVLVLAALPLLAQAQDGRINEVAHLGGAAVYCVDVDMVPAGSYAEGGIQVLDINGQPLLFAPAADIDAVGDELAENTLIAEANGLSLYRLTTGDFQLNGYDEHGKLFEFAFASCEPMGAPAEPEEPESEPVEVEPESEQE